MLLKALVLFLLVKLNYSESIINGPSELGTLFVMLLR